MFVNKKHEEAIKKLQETVDQQTKSINEVIANQTKAVEHIKFLHENLELLELQFDLFVEKVNSKRPLGKKKVKVKEQEAYIEVKEPKYE